MGKNKRRHSENSQQHEIGNREYYYSLGSVSFDDATLRKKKKKSSHSIAASENSLTHSSSSDIKKNWLQSADGLNFFQDTDGVFSKKKKWKRNGNLLELTQESTSIGDLYQSYKSIAVENKIHKTNSHQSSDTMKAFQDNGEIFRKKKKKKKYKSDESIGDVNQSCETIKTECESVNVSSLQSSPEQLKLSQSGDKLFPKKRTKKSKLYENVLDLTQESSSIGDLDQSCDTTRAAIDQIPDQLKVSHSNDGIFPKKRRKKTKMYENILDLTQEALSISAMDQHIRAEIDQIFLQPSPDQLKLSHGNDGIFPKKRKKKTKLDGYVLDLTHESSSISDLDQRSGTIRAESDQIFLQSSPDQLKLSHNNDGIFPKKIKKKTKLNGSELDLTQESSSIGDLDQLSDTIRADIDKSFLQSSPDQLKISHNNDNDGVSPKKRKKKTKLNGNVLDLTQESSSTGDLDQSSDIIISKINRMSDQLKLFYNETGIFPKKRKKKSQLYGSVLDLSEESSSAGIKTDIHQTQSVQCTPDWLQLPQGNNEVFPKKKKKKHKLNGNVLDVTQEVSCETTKTENATFEEVSSVQSSLEGLELSEDNQEVFSKKKKKKQKFNGNMLDVTQELSPENTKTENVAIKEVPSVQSTLNGLELSEDNHEVFSKKKKKKQKFDGNVLDVKQEVSPESTKSENATIKGINYPVRDNILNSVDNSKNMHKDSPKNKKEKDRPLVQSVLDWLELSQGNHEVIPKKKKKKHKLNGNVLDVTQDVSCESTKTENAAIEEVKAALPVDLDLSYEVPALKKKKKQKHDKPRYSVLDLLEKELNTAYEDKFNEKLDRFDATEVDVDRASDISFRNNLVTTSTPKKIKKESNLEVFTNKKHENSDETEQSVNKSKRKHKDTKEHDQQNHDSDSKSDKEIEEFSKVCQERSHLLKTDDDVDKFSDQDSYVSDDADENRTDNSLKSTQKRTSRNDCGAAYDYQVTWRDRQALENLYIDINFKESPLHTISDRASRPTKAALEEVAKMEILVRKGKFTKEEDEILRSNWEEFVEKAQIGNNPCLFFSFRDKPWFSKENRAIFLKYLGRGLEDRFLYNVHQRFIVLYRSTFLNKGRFTEEEDSKILEYTKNSKSGTPFLDLAKSLDRSVASIEKRVQRLTQNNYDRTLKWTKKRIQIHLKYLLKVTQCSTVEELRNRNISLKEWKELSKNLDDVPWQRLRSVWEKIIYPRLFIEDHMDMRKVKLTVIKRMYQKGENDWKKVNWSHYASEFEGLTALKLYSVIKTFVGVHIKNEKTRDNLGKCLEILRIVIANPSAIRMHYLKKLVYEDGVIKEAPSIKASSSEGLE